MAGSHSSHMFTMAEVLDILDEAITSASQSVTEVMMTLECLRKEVEITDMNLTITGSSNARATRQKQHAQLIVCSFNVHSSPSTPTLSPDNHPSVALSPPSLRAPSFLTQSSMEEGSSFIQLEWTHTSLPISI